MRVRWYGSLVVGLSFLVAGVARSDDQAEAKPVLDKALKAMGGEAKLAKLQTGIGKGKITGQENGQELTLTFDASWQGLDKYRLDAEVNIGGMTMKGLMVVNGDKAWAKMGDQVQEA